MIAHRFWTALWSAAALILVFGSGAIAQPRNVDWKLYGSATFTEPTLCFYDFKGIEYRPDTLIRVWTKCLRQRELDAIDAEKEFDGVLLENTARKVLDGYIPPIATVETIGSDQSMAITLYEEMADTGTIQPEASIFYELNCPERMMRELTISAEVRGKTQTDNEPGTWKHIPPEGNAARLLNILCPSG